MQSSCFGRIQTSIHSIISVSMFLKVVSVNTDSPVLELPGSKCIIYIREVTAEEIYSLLDGVEIALGAT